MEDVWRPGLLHAGTEGQASFIFASEEDRALGALE